MTGSPAVPSIRIGATMMGGRVELEIVTRTWPGTCTVPSSTTTSTVAVSPVAAPSWAATSMTVLPSISASTGPSTPVTSKLRSSSLRSFAALTRSRREVSPSSETTIRTVRIVGGTLPSGVTSIGIVRSARLPSGSLSPSPSVTSTVIDAGPT